jgi:hypothetical protein
MYSNLARWADSCCARRCYARRNPRAQTSEEHPEGLWTTGRPDDPRRSEPDRYGRGSQASAVPHSPCPRANASWQSFIFLDRIQEMESNCSERDVIFLCTDQSCTATYGLTYRIVCAIWRRSLRNEVAPPWAQGMTEIAARRCEKHRRAKEPMRSHADDRSRAGGVGACARRERRIRPQRHVVHGDASAS